MNHWTVCVETQNAYNFSDWRLKIIIFIQGSYIKFLKLTRFYSWFCKLTEWSPCNFNICWMYTFMFSMFFLQVTKKKFRTPLIGFNKYCFACKLGNKNDVTQRRDCIVPPQSLLSFSALIVMGSEVLAYSAHLTPWNRAQEDAILTKHNILNIIQSFLY